MDDTDERENPQLRLVMAGIFLVIMVGAGVDLVLDQPETLWSAHVLFELGMLLVSLGAASYLALGWFRAMAEVRQLQQAVEERQAERDAWKARAGQILEGLSQAMDAQFTEWELTPAERETAVMLLKGHSHKRIGKLTGRSDRTVRQHAVAVYRKAGLGGRSELSGFFLDGLFASEPTSTE